MDSSRRSPKAACRRRILLVGGQLPESRQRFLLGRFLLWSTVRRYFIYFVLYVLFREFPGGTSEKEGQVRKGTDQIHHHYTKSFHRRNRPSRHVFAGTDV
jgi:hypothetical protein